MYQLSDVVFTKKLPKLSTFMKNKDPIVNFYNWVLKQMGEKPTGKNNKEFAPDVCLFWITEESGNEFKKLLAEFRRKKHRWRKADAEERVSWEWFGSGPATFYGRKDTPDWVKPGHVYVMKDWKKPPRITIENAGWASEHYIINTTPATKAEVDALIAKHGEENLWIDKKQGGYR